MLRDAPPGRRPCKRQSEIRNRQWQPEETAIPVPDLYREALGPLPATNGGSWLALLTRHARRAGRAGLGLLFPAHCLSCGTPLGEGNCALCGKCAGAIAWIGADRCRRCGNAVGEGRGAVEACPECASHPPAYVSAACAVARYGEPLRGLILALKFSAALQTVPLLGRLLALRVRATRLGSAGILPAPVLQAGSLRPDRATPVGQARMPALQPVLVPVPLHPADFRRRGFNQAEELARVAARVLGLRVEAGLLRKTRPSPPQAILGREARLENLRGAFAARLPARRHPGRAAVILVDDVMTTGATASECARTLREAGVKEVRVAVLARG